MHDQQPDTHLSVTGMAFEVAVSATAAGTVAADALLTRVAQGHDIPQIAFPEVPLEFVPAFALLAIGQVLAKRATNEIADGHVARARSLLLGSLACNAASDAWVSGYNAITQPAANSHEVLVWLGVAAAAVASTAMATLTSSLRILFFSTNRARVRN